MLIGIAPITSATIVQALYLATAAAAAARAQPFFLASERVTLVVEAFSAVGKLLPMSSFAFRCPWPARSSPWPVEFSFNADREVRPAVAT